jgi:hypothetical protein
MIKFGEDPLGLAEMEPCSPDYMICVANGSCVSTGTFRKLRSVLADMNYSGSRTVVVETES